MTGIKLVKDGEDVGYTCPDDPGEAPYPDKPKRISVTDQEADILKRLATGKVVLEIGTGLGVAAKAMLEHADLVRTIDIDKWVIDNIHPMLEKLGILCYTKIPSNLEEVEMVFIDGDHRLAGQDVEMAKKVLASGGFIVVHDSKSVRPLIQDKMYEIDTHYGLGLIFPTGQL